MLIQYKDIRRASVWLYDEVNEDFSALQIFFLPDQAMVKNPFESHRTGMFLFCNKH